MRWPLTCKTLLATWRSPTINGSTPVVPIHFNVLTSHETSMGDLNFGRSFDIKEPGTNPLKTIPHNIVEYMKFYYPVSL